MTKLTLETELFPLVLDEIDTASDEEYALKALDNLAVTIDGETYYKAAEPGYRSSFTRDSLVAMSLVGTPEYLMSQVDYSANRLGVKEDPITGEEPGKAHHELPSVVIDGRSTAYNASDTTAEFLRSVAVLAEHGFVESLNKYKMTAIPSAINYIKRHVNSNGLFQEDPAFAGVLGTDGHSRHFAINVTYWKDSVLNRRGAREPNYPIVYGLAHFQNAAALQRIGRVLGDSQLVDFGKTMEKTGLNYLWSKDHFLTAVDGDGVVDGPSSDSLLTLLYIAPDSLPIGYAQKILDYSRQLETPAGYRSGIPVEPGINPYHMMVWVHEQALLHAASSRHGLPLGQQVAERIREYINPKDGLFPEFVDPEKFEHGGNDLQLWAIGAYFYFNNPLRSLL